jgi:hypothetical protein
VNGEFRRRKVLMLGLLAANVVLVLVIASGLYATNGNPAQEGTGTAAPLADVAKMPPHNLPTPALNNYAEIVERPLFNQGRRPSRGTENESVTSDNPLVLVGTVITPERREALFLSRQDKAVVRALLGEWVEGWKVDSIEPDRVTVRRDERTAEILLERGSASTTAGKKQGGPAPAKK